MVQVDLAPMTKPNRSFRTSDKFEKFVVGANGTNYIRIAICGPNNIITHTHVTGIRSRIPFVSTESYAKCRR